MYDKNERYVPTHTRATNNIEWLSEDLMKHAKITLELRTTKKEKKTRLVGKLENVNAQVENQRQKIHLNDIVLIHDF